MDGFPTVVAIYDVGRETPCKVAEFRLTPAGNAELVMTGSIGCRVAEQWYERGIIGHDRSGRIRPNEGSRFLHAVLGLPGMSYYRLVDESPRDKR
ncbi:hypothetical protein ACWDOP_15015 [Nocardia sp. NPDC003693]